MNIGIAFDLKPDGPLPPGAPDDLYEEFDAPVTVRSIAAVLRQMGHAVRELGDGKPLIEALLKDPPDLVFNLAEGTGISRSREARVPALCEMFGIPHTGSDPLALAVALDKDLTRKLVKAAGVAVPEGFTLSFPPGDYDGDFAEFPPMLTESGLVMPVIAKPVCEGSSKGVRSRCLIRTAAEFGPTVWELWKNYQQPVLVEEYIAGDEVTVGIVGNDPPQVLGVMKIMPKAKQEHFVYSVEVKRDYLKLVEYECPAKLPIALTREIESQALTIYHELGCRDVARLDFRIREGVPYFLEINPLPGLNPESSDLVILANLMSITHADLVKQIVTAAISRLKA